MSSVMFEPMPVVTEEEEEEFTMDKHRQKSVMVETENEDEREQVEVLEHVASVAKMSSIADSDEADAGVTILGSVMNPQSLGDLADEFCRKPEVVALLEDHDTAQFPVQKLEIDGKAFQLDVADVNFVRIHQGSVLLSVSSNAEGDGTSISLLDIQEFAVFYGKNTDEPAGVRFRWTDNIGTSNRARDQVKSFSIASSLRRNLTDTEDDGPGEHRKGTRPHMLQLTTPDAEDLALLVSNLLMQLSELRLIFQHQQRESRTLRIVHFNDVYHLDPVSSSTVGLVGGASRFHTVLQQLRAQSNVLVLFSGDFMGPSLMSVEMKGRQMVDCFNVLGVDYGVFGNHEFDYGLKALKEAVHGFTHSNLVYSGSRTQWIMSNMTEPNPDSKESGSTIPLGGAKEYAVFPWSGVMVGIVGLCENWLPGCSQLAPKEAEYQDIYVRGEELAKKLKRELGAEIVIALSHCRLNIDKEIKARCPSIDLLLGGHDHFHKNLISSCGVLKSGEEFQYLSEIAVQFSGDGVGEHKIHLKTHPITSSIETSPVMEAVIRRYQSKLDDRMGKVIGRTLGPLDPTENACRFREGVLTGFVCDVMCTEADADFAVLGGAAISGKAVMPSGSNITVGDIFAWFPNDTKVMTLKLKGSTVLKMLNVMVKECPKEAPSFPHCSSELSFSINVIKIGDRQPFVEDVCVSGHPINPTAVYTVALEDFAAEGNAKYKFVPQECVETVTDAENAAQLVFWVKSFFEDKKGQKHAALDHPERSPNGSLPGRRKSRAYSNFSESGWDPGNQLLEERTNSQKSRTNSEARGSVQQATGTNTSLVKYPAGPGADPMDQEMFKVAEFRPHQFLSTLETKTVAQLNNMNQRLSEEVEVNSLVRLVRGAMKTLVQSEDARLYLFDPEAQTLRQAGAVGQAGRMFHLSDETLPSIVARERAVVRITKDGAGEEYRGNSASAAPGAFVSPRSSVDHSRAHSPHLHRGNTLTFPVLHHDDLLGVVLCEKKMADERDELDYFGEEEEVNFSAADSGIALLFARQLATQLHFTILYQRMKQSEAATSALLEVATTLNQAAREQPIADVSLKIADCAKEVIGCDRASVFLIDGQEMWTTVSTYVDGAKRQQTIRIPVGTGVAGQSALKKEIWNVHDAYQCEHFNPEPDRRSGYTTRNILCLPMNNEAGDVMGVLQLINKKDGAVFNNHDETVAEEYLRVATATVQNCTEIQTLKLGIDSSAVQSMPIHELDRIHMKAGWSTVRSWLKRILVLGRMQAQHTAGRVDRGLGVRGSRVFGPRFSEWEPPSFVNNTSSGSLMPAPPSTGTTPLLPLRRAGGSDGSGRLNMNASTEWGQRKVNKESPSHLGAFNPQSPLGNSNANFPSNTKQYGPTGK